MDRTTLRMARVFRLLIVGLTLLAMLVAASARPALAAFSFPNAPEPVYRLSAT
jgi:hypothetical protein